MKNNLLKEVIDQEIKLTEQYIIERAKTYNEELSEDDMFHLFILEPKGIVAKYDCDDLINHNYDLGYFKALTMIKEII